MRPEDKLWMVALAAISIGFALAVAGSAETPGECEAVRPYPVECRTCSQVKTRDTGNSTSGGGKIIAERMKCKGCIVEFRVDLECLPPPIPQAQT
jgi:hypothetical protein